VSVKVVLIKTAVASFELLFKLLLKYCYKVDIVSFVYYEQVYNYSLNGRQ